MKIVSIVSSYRKNGNTSNVLKLIENNITILAKRNNVSLEIERIMLGHGDVKVCRGCRLCFEIGEEKCPLKDDLLLIKDKLLGADGIILASPVYVEDINGIMKNWIDRMAFYCHRPTFAGKTALLITTSGIGSTNHSLNTMKRAIQAWGFYIAGECKFRTGALMNISAINELYSNKITRISNKLYESIARNKAINPKFYSLVSFKVQQKYWQKHKDDSIDYWYWAEKGWIQSKRKFYINNSASYFKGKR